MFPIVSIITPCFNSYLFISQTIDSVLSQTYTNWEMIIVDDCSTDDSAKVIKEYCNRDARIKYLKTDVASGSPVKPRNIGVSKAQGRFIAFLDSDDVWLPNKLEMQLPLFDESNVAIVYSYYKAISEDGQLLGGIIKSKCFHTYSTLLYGNEIGCLTSIVDTTKVGKCYFQYVGHEDYVLWLSILKKGFIAKGVQSVLGLYRIRKSSVSSNKIKVVSWVWYIYYKIEKLPFLASLFYLCTDLFKSFVKLLKCKYSLYES